MTHLGGMELRQPIRNLGSVDERLDGIFSPGYSDNEVGLHIHDVFLEKVDDYLAFCPVNRGLIDHWKELIRTAIGSDIGSEGLNIVDIGSGQGTSVFPMAELTPGSSVMATDLSIPLLLQIRKFALGAGYRNLTVLQMNAENMVFSDAQADIVMGGHVLHHALSLAGIFAEIRRVLKPRGVAVFWEPFEDGGQLIAGIFDLWIEMDRYQTKRLAPEVIAAMHSFTADLQRRVGRIKPPGLLETLDDKWWFSTQHIQDLAQAAGFPACDIRNVYEPNNVVRMMTDHELRRWGFSLDSMPSWAQEKLLAVQSRFSDDYLRGHPFSASIVMRP